MNRDNKKNNLNTWHTFFLKKNLDYFQMVKNVNESYLDKLTNAFIEKPFNYFSPGRLKVVIIGQDPYPKKGDATGLAFDVPRSTTLPPTLKNILKKVAIEYSLEHSNLVFKGLEQWSKQGVLLINSIPVITKNISDKRKFKQITSRLLSLLEHENKNIMFIGWGKDAMSVFKEAEISNENIIWGVHPSPLSSHRGFFDKEYFCSCNRELSLRSISEVNWLKAFKN